MCIKQKSDFYNKSIHIILVYFCASLPRFILLPGYGSTFPEVDPDPAIHSDKY